METLSQAEVGSALQIYFNLNELPKVILASSQILFASNQKSLH